MTADLSKEALDGAELDRLVNDLWERIAASDARRVEKAITALRAENEALRLDLTWMTENRNKWQDSAMSRYNRATAAEAALAAAMEGAVRVKPLEWQEPCKMNNLTHLAKSCFGDYYVDIDGGRHQAWLEAYEKPHEVLIGDPSATIYEAQSAAQADYERRILAALETNPAAQDRDALDSDPSFASDCVEILQVAVDNWNELHPDEPDEIFMDLQRRATALATQPQTDALATRDAKMRAEGMMKAAEIAEMAFGYEPEAGDMHAAIQCRDAILAAAQNEAGDD